MVVAMSRRVSRRFGAGACGLHAAPGIAYSKIVEGIASANGLCPFVTVTCDKHLGVLQSTISAEGLLWVRESAAPVGVNGNGAWGGELLSGGYGGLLLGHRNFLGAGLGRFGLSSAA